MSYVCHPRTRRRGASSVVRRAVLLLASAALGSCGLLTNPDSPDAVFNGTITRTSMPFHQFTAPRSGELTASIEWATGQSHQTVCVVQSDLADVSATCAAALAGRSNAVRTLVQSGVAYTIYGAPDFSADAQYSIEVRVHTLTL